LAGLHRPIPLIPAPAATRPRELLLRASSLQQQQKALYGSQASLRSRHVTATGMPLVASSLTGGWSLSAERLACDRSAVARRRTSFSFSNNMIRHRASARSRNIDRDRRNLRTACLRHPWPIHRTPPHPPRRDSSPLSRPSRTSSSTSMTPSREDSRRNALNISEGCVASPMRPSGIATHGSARRLGMVWIDPLPFRMTGSAVLTASPLKGAVRRPLAPSTSIEDESSRGLLRRGVKSARRRVCRKGH
jgi:hypothetical protein